MEKFKPIEYREFVDPVYQQAMYKYVTDINFPWHFMEDATTELINTVAVSTPSFGHLVYYHKHEENPHFDFFKPMLDAIETKCNMKVNKLLRMRLGFLLNTKYPLPSMPYKFNTPHKDYDQEHFTAVYYVNQTDGETVIFNETEPAAKYYPMHRCMPERNKLLLFNGMHYHSSTCPKVFTKRIALTINFVGEPK